MDFRFEPILLQKSPLKFVIAPWQLDRAYLPLPRSGGDGTLTETPNATGESHSTPGGYALWWWATDQSAEAAQILGDGGERELELCAAWTSQSEPAEP